MSDIPLPDHPIRKHWAWQAFDRLWRPATGWAVFDSVPVKDEAGELIEVELEGEPVPLMAQVPRMVTKAKTETVPVMEDFEEEFTEMEPTGETRGALR